MLCSGSKILFVGVAFSLQLIKSQTYTYTPRAATITAGKTETLRLSNALEINRDFLCNSILYMCVSRIWFYKREREKNMFTEEEMKLIECKTQAQVASCAAFCFFK